jgi:hypothetical protein
MKPMLIFIAGTKGGVGKSFTAIMLAGAAMDLGLSLTVYDTDNENRTLGVLMPEQSTFLDETSEQYPLDEVINGLFADTCSDVTIVDMKAGTSRSTQEWFLSVPWDDLQNADIDVYVVGCITSDPDSVRTFVPWLTYFRDINLTVHFLIVKNLMDGDHFFSYSSLLEPAMKKLNINYQVFIFHAVEQKYINTLNENNLTIRVHINSKPTVLTTVMQKSRLRKHYFAITDQFVEFFATKLGTEEMNDARKQLLQSIRKRADHRKTMEKVNNAGRKK